MDENDLTDGPIDLGRLRALPREELMGWAEEKISDTVHEICDEDAVTSEIASTNAVGWGIDVFDVLDVTVGEGEVRVQVGYILCGDQDDERTWSGTEISGEATAIIELDGTIYYRNVTAERDLGEPDYGPDPNDKDIYRDDSLAQRAVLDPIQEIKRYFAEHPEKLYDLAPRRFEELIADILKDLGFDTELTKATRDGGRDIYAYVRNAVTSFLMFVECKRWARHNKVGIEIVQRVHGAAEANGADKAMIVTTSFFTLPAQKEHAKIHKKMELADFGKLKTWLARYK